MMKLPRPGEPTRRTPKGKIPFGLFGSGSGRFSLPPDWELPRPLNTSEIGVIPLGKEGLVEGASMCSIVILQGRWGKNLITLPWHAAPYQMRSEMPAKTQEASMQSVLGHLRSGNTVDRSTTSMVAPRNLLDVMIKHVNEVSNGKAKITAFLVPGKFTTSDVKGKFALDQLRGILREYKEKGAIQRFKTRGISTWGTKQGPPPKERTVGAFGVFIHKDGKMNLIGVRREKLGQA